MKIYKFYSPEIKDNISCEAFMPEYDTRLLGWTSSKKYREWFKRTRLKGTYDEVISDVEKNSYEWEDLEVDYGDYQLITKRLKNDNRAEIGVILPRIAEVILDSTELSTLQSSIQMVFPIKRIPDGMMSASLREHLGVLSYDILCDETGDDFTLDAEGVRNGYIPAFWYYLFSNYEYLDIDGVLETSKQILKYLDEIEEDD